VRLETEDEDCGYSTKAFPLAIKDKFCARQIQLASMTRNTDNICRYDVHCNGGDEKPNDDAIFSAISIEAK